MILFDIWLKKNKYYKEKGGKELKFFVIAKIEGGLWRKTKSKEFCAKNEEAAKEESFRQFPGKIEEIILYQLLGPGETVEWVGEEFILDWAWRSESGWEGPFFVPGHEAEYKWARRPKWRKFLDFLIRKEMEYPKLI